LTRPSPSTLRALVILEYLGANSQEFFSLTELSYTLGLNKATANACLTAFVDAGYVTRHRADNTFTLGPEFSRLAAAATRGRRAIIQAARPEMELLSELSGTQVAANIIVGDELVLVSVAGVPASPQPLAYRARMFPPIGMLFVAWASETAVGRWLDTVSSTEEDRERYQQLLEYVREQGYVVSANREPRDRLDQLMRETQHQELTEQVREQMRALAAQLVAEEAGLRRLDPDTRYRVKSISAPVFDPAGGVEMALILRGFRELRGAEILELAALVTKSAERVTAAVGGHVRCPDGIR
jgi:DNA-binding IclR family transcriptional regulator